MVLQLENRLRESLDRLKLRDQTSARYSLGNLSRLEGMLQQLSTAAQTQSSQLAKLEASCFNIPGAGTGLNAETRTMEQEATSQGLALDGMLAALLQARAGMEEVVRSSRQQHLPASKIGTLQSASVFTSFLLLCICANISPQCPPQTPFHLQVSACFDTFRSPFKLKNETHSVGSCFSMSNN